MTVTGEITAQPRAFRGVTRWHVLDPASQGFSYCGVWRAGATTFTASSIEHERCDGGCKAHWPMDSGSSEAER